MTLLAPNFLPLASLVLLSAALAGAQDSTWTNYEAYNVVWTSPSADETGSIPLGNGNVGINLWVEEDGDLLFYVSRNDAWAEQMTLCKLGRVRVALHPNPFRKGFPYRQKLKLVEGRCEIEAGQAGQRMRIGVVVDSDSPNVQLLVRSEVPASADVSVFNWRNERVNHHHQITRSQAWISLGAPAEVPFWESADVFDASESEAITTWHRNQYSPVPEHIRQQGMDKYANLILPLDPLTNNTFGMRLTMVAPETNGCQRIADNALRLKRPAKEFEIRVSTHARQTPDAATFLAELRALASNAVPANVAMERTAKWWRQFWGRSWVFVSGDVTVLPPNQHSIRVGADSAGGSGFTGEMGRASILGRVLTEAEIGALAAQPRDRKLDGERELVASTLGGGSHPTSSHGTVAPFDGQSWYEVGDSTNLAFAQGLTLEAWVKPATVAGRLFDKCTPGSAQGLTFDLYDQKLRLICGNNLIGYSEESITPGVWQHVACTIDPATGGARFYLNGKASGHIGGNAEEPTPSSVTRAYVLAKYQLACQMRSPYPAHFQGGIFTMDPRLAWYATDPRDQPVTPDYRFYGVNYWWQNLRFLYQPQLAQGNREFHRALMLFMHKLAPAMEARAERYYGAKGIYFEECFTPFGIPSMFDFGWGAKEYSEPYARWTWQHCLEASVMMLDDYAYTGDEKFLTEVAVPYATKSLEFFDTRFKRDEQGRIRIFPTHALETYWNDVVNDTPSVAGLHYVCTRLLALPERLTPAASRDYWRKVQAQLPPIPKTVVGGCAVPDNAESYPFQKVNRGQQGRANYEAPDLYTVFPFRVYGLELAEHNLGEARAAWRIMPNPGHCCWYQTGLFAARLGLADGAAEDVMIRSRTRMVRTSKADRPAFRFPGFFGSPHDWCPDYDGPGNMMSVLQEMLLQNGEHGELLLLPAWPKGWDVTFKLHAAQNTIVECDYRQGKVARLEVSPASRRKDVKLLNQ